MPGILARARATLSPAVARVLAPRAPVRVAQRAAEPVASRPGASPFHAAGAAPIAPPPLPLWNTDPVTGERLPEGPRVELPPGAFVEARVAHRHGWFAARAHAAARGDAAAAAEAVAAMDAWLRQDIPGTGLAWAHASDLAARLVHWHAGLAWLGEQAPGWLRAAMAGSAAWHLAHLRDRMPQGDAHRARRVAHHAGLVVGAFSFPDLPEARGAWSDGLSGLRYDLPALLHPDGSPRDAAPLRLAETLWYAALARAVARANGGAFPADADAALMRGARYLERLAGEIGTLPATGEAPLGDLLAGGTPLAWSLWNLVRAWGLDAGAPAPGAASDARLAWLGAEAGHGEPELAGKSWAMWVYRDSGEAVAHLRIKNRPSRVFAAMGTPDVVSPATHLAPLHVLWDIGDAAILADPGPSEAAGERGGALRSAASHGGLLLDGHVPTEPMPALLGVARVDGRKARIEGQHTGWAAHRIPLAHARDLLLNQARLVVTDRLVPGRGRVGRHAVRLVWQLGPGWTLTPDGAGYLAKRDDLTLVIQLPAALAWSVRTGDEAPGGLGWVRVPGAPPVPAPCLVGDGGVEGELELVSSFEIR